MRRQHLWIVFMMVMTAPAAFANQFQVDLVVSDHQFSYTLRFGTDPRGSDGYDPGLDLYAPPPPPAGSFDARFQWMGNDLFADIRFNSDATREFILRYQPSSQHQVVLRWNEERVKELGRFLIVDRFSGTLFGPVDMSQVDSLLVSDPLIGDGLKILVTPAVPNSPPVARDDVYKTEEDCPIRFDPLANDTDLENDPLTIVMLDTSRLSGRLLKSPLEESFIYQPAPDFAGEDGFSYVISDGGRTSDTARVTLLVEAVDDQPRWRNLPDTLSIGSRLPAEISVWNWVDDPDTPAEELTYSFYVIPEIVKWEFIPRSGTLVLYPGSVDHEETAKIIMKLSDGSHPPDEAAVLLTFSPDTHPAGEKGATGRGVIRAGNFPNPFNNSTIINLEIGDPVDLKLVIYNSVGERVMTLWEGRIAAGQHRFHWEGIDERGVPLASGVYLYRISAGKKVQTGRMLLVR